MKMMDTREAMKMAREKMQGAAAGGSTQDVLFYSKVVYMMSERLWQEQAVNKFDPFHVDEVLKLLNNYQITIDRTREMKDNPEKFGAFFMHSVIAGIGE